MLAWQAPPGLGGQGRGLLLPLVALGGRGALWQRGHTECVPMRLTSPIRFGLALHRWGVRVLGLEPRAAGACDACHAWMDRNWSTVILPRNAAGRRRCRPAAYPCPQDARSATGVPRRDKGYTVVMLLREAWMSRAEP